MSAPNEVIDAERLYKQSVEWLYERDGHEFNMKRGMSLLKLSANAGYPPAMFDLGMTLLKGFWFEKMDGKVAIEWIVKAADAGDSLARARCVRDGLGTYVVDNNKHYEYLSQVDLSRPYAYFHWSVAYDAFPLAGTKNDLEKSHEYEAKGIALGCVYCLYNYAWTLHNGDKVTWCDFAQARTLYEQLAAKGAAEGMCGLGCMNRDGFGGLPDPKEAFKWFARSALQGDKTGSQEAARFRFKGLGGRIDYEECVRFMRMADDFEFDLKRPHFPIM